MTDHQLGSLLQFLSGSFESQSGSITDVILHFECLMGTNIGNVLSTWHCYDLFQLTDGEAKKSCVDVQDSLSMPIL